MLTERRWKRKGKVAEVDEKGSLDATRELLTLKGDAGRDR
jgi:hypothetical protein